MIRRASSSPPAVAGPGSVLLPDPVARALLRFARLSRRVLFWEGLCWWGLLVLLLLTLLAGADHWLWLEEGTRAALAVGFYLLAGCAGILLLRRALRPRDLVQTALALEQRAKGALLEERISTTVELAGGGAVEAGLSRLLIERVAGEAAERIGRLDISGLIDRSGLRRAGLAFGLTVAGVLAAVFWPGLPLPRLWARAALPWANLARPGRIEFQVVPGDARIVAGEILEVRVQLPGPGGWAELLGSQRVLLETQEGQGQRGWQVSRMEAAPGAAEGSSFRLKLGPLYAGLAYRVRLADGLSAVHRVEVLPRPEVKRIQLMVQEPAYTGRPPQVFDRFSGDVSVLQGSNIQLQVEASVPLSAGIVEFEGGQRRSLAVEGCNARGGFKVERSLKYRLRLRSREGVPDPEAPLYLITAHKDQPPLVEVVEPAAEELVEPGAVVALELKGQDDIGLESLRIAIRSDDHPQPRSVEIPRPAGADKVWLVVFPWRLSGLFLRPGEILAYQVEALDKAGNLGVSAERRLRVAKGRRPWMAPVLRDLEEARRSLAAARKLFEGVSAECAEMRQAFRWEDPALRAADRLLLLETLKRTAQETYRSAATLDAALPEAERGPLFNLLAALADGMLRFALQGFQPLLRVGQEASASKGPTIQAALDALCALAPEAQARLLTYQEALHAAYRYAGACRVVDQAEEIVSFHRKLLPALLAASAWGQFEGQAAVPGLLGEYFSGTDLKQLVRRTVDRRWILENEPLPEVGRGNFSVRWSGEMLAPKTGKYIFRLLADDGVRLLLDHKPLIDQWKVQDATPMEESVVLEAGWHPFELSFFQAGEGYVLKLERAGSELRMEPIPCAQFRTVGTPPSAPGSPALQQAMSRGYSRAELLLSLTRLRILVQTARALPLRLRELAELAPGQDVQALREAVAWKAEIDRLTAGLLDLQAADPAMVDPLARWQEQAEPWLKVCQGQQLRYRAALSRAVRLIEGDARPLSSSLRGMQARAQTAFAVSQRLAQLAQQPASPEREAALAGAEAEGRALVRDLHERVTGLGALLRAASRQGQRAVSERKALLGMAEELELCAEQETAALGEGLRASPLPAADPAASGAQVRKVATRVEAFLGKAERLEKLVELRKALAAVAARLETAQELLDAPGALADQDQGHALWPALREDLGALKEAQQRVGEMPSLEIPEWDGGEEVPKTGPLGRLFQRLLRQGAERPGTGGEGAAATARSEGEELKLRDELVRQIQGLRSGVQLLERNLVEQSADSAVLPEAQLAGLVRELWGAVAASDLALRGGVHPPVENAALLRQARTRLERLQEHAALEAHWMRMQELGQAGGGTLRQQSERMLKLATAMRQILRAAPGAHEESAPTRPAPRPESELLSLHERLCEFAGQADLLAAAAAPGQEEALDELLQSLELKPELDSALVFLRRVEEVTKSLRGRASVAPGASGSSRPPLEASQAELRALLARPGPEEPRISYGMGTRLEQLAGWARQALEREAQVANQQQWAAELARQARANSLPMLAQALLHLKLAGQAVEVSAPPPESPLGRAVSGLKECLPQLRRDGERLKEESGHEPAARLAAAVEAWRARLEGQAGALAQALAQAADPSAAPVARAGLALQQAAGEAAAVVRDLAGGEELAQVAQRSARQAGSARAELERRIGEVLSQLEPSGVLGRLEGKESEAVRRSTEAARRPAPPVPTPLPEAVPLEPLAEVLGRVARSAREPVAGSGGAPATEGERLAGAGAVPQLELGLEILGKARAAELRGDAAAARTLVLEASQALEAGIGAAHGRLSGVESRSPRGGGRRGPVQDGGDLGLRFERGYPEGDLASRGEAGGGREPGREPAAGPALAGLPPPPEHLPIDRETWNRLPDSLRRDLLNASDGRYPAEFEASIRKYFKRLAVGRVDSPKERGR